MQYSMTGRSRRKQIPSVARRPDFNLLLRVILAQDMSEQYQYIYGPIWSGRHNEWHYHVRGRTGVSNILDRAAVSRNVSRCSSENSLPRKLISRRRSSEPFWGSRLSPEWVQNPAREPFGSEHTQKVGAQAMARNLTREAVQSHCVERARYRSAL